MSNVLNTVAAAMVASGHLEIVHVAPPLAGAGRLALIKALAGFNSSKFVAITWFKDDGSERSAVINPLDFSGVKGDSAAPSAQAAVATRKRTNPDLWNVIDHSAKGRKRREATKREPWISIRCRGKITLKQGETIVNLDLG